jgi:adenylate cyclase
MPSKEFQRRLVAILSADVVGYSRLMGDDEEATVRTITIYREVMSSRIKENNGRVVDAKGDNLLAEFSSVVDSVRCADEIQKELQSKNKDLPEHRRMLFRIGINLGDVIEDRDTIYGDGVNIAARLESLADPGGICISRGAHDQVLDRLDLAFEYLGEQEVKNIARPIRAYRVVTEPEDGPAEAAEAPPLSDIPSIAVLPFDNLSGDPSQEYFSDGMTEEIISGLSKIPNLLVIARNSTFTYKGKPVKVQEVGRDLGVRYVLEGSIRKSGNRVRITAQLIEAQTGHHLWAERWDREMEDIFALQDEITRKIIVGTQVKLTEGEQVRIWEEQDRPDNLEAFELVLQGEGFYSQLSSENNTIARQMFEKALALEPDYTGALVLLAWTHLMDAWMGWAKNPLESFGKAAELAQRALALNDSLDMTQALMGMIHVYRKEYDQALVAAEKAVSLSPSGADAHGWLAIVQSSCGRHREALDSMKRAYRLNPLPPGWYYFILGRIHFFTGEFEQALAVINKSRSFVSEGGPVLFNLVVANSLAGKIEEAKAFAAKFLEYYPDFSLDQTAEMMPYKDPKDIDLVIQAMRRAGLE